MSFLSITDVTPSITDIPYLTDALAQTGYVLLEEGEYIISVTPANSKTVVLESPLFNAQNNLNAQNNRIYTAFIVNGETADAVPRLILGDDFEEPIRLSKPD